jgi:hypothetical protein
MCLDGTSVCLGNLDREFNFGHVTGRIDPRVKMHLSRSVCPDDSLTCLDRPGYKLVGRVFSLLFSPILPFFTKILASLS